MNLPLQPTIVCPVCKVRQHGTISFLHKSRMAYIKCGFTSCQHIMYGDELEEIMRPIVQFPGDVRKHKTFLNQ